MSFVDAADPATYARFTKDVATPGDCIFTLTAKDGEYTESSDVIVALYYNGCDAAKGEEEDYQIKYVFLSDINDDSGALHLQSGSPCIDLGNNNAVPAPGTNDDIVHFDWYKVDACAPNFEDFLASGEIIDCNLPLGEHIIVLEVIDKSGAFDTNEVTIIVQDTTPPDFTLSVTPTMLWPASHFAPLNIVLHFTQTVRFTGGQ